MTAAKPICPALTPAAGSQSVPTWIEDGAQGPKDDKQRPGSAAKLLCATVVGGAMQPDAEKKHRPIEQGIRDDPDRGRQRQAVEVVRVAHGECGQHECVQREGQAEAPRSEVLGVRRVREGAGDGVQRRNGLAALEVVAARAAPRQQRLP